MPRLPGPGNILGRVDKVLKNVYDVLGRGPDRQRLSPGRSQRRATSSASGAPWR